MVRGLSEVTNWESSHNRRSHEVPDLARLGQRARKHKHVTPRTVCRGIIIEAAKESLDTVKIYQDLEICFSG